MTLRIACTRPATDAEWDAIWADCEYATYFHSREWADIWHVYSRGKIFPNPQHITFSDGKECLLPISSEKRLLGLLTIGLSSPVGTFGGWLSKDYLLSEHASLMMDYITSHFRGLRWRMNPYDPNMPLTTGRPLVDDDTYVLDLTRGFDAVSGEWSRDRNSLARKIRKASGAGISVRCADSMDDWRSYYQAYEESLERWGDRASSFYRWDLFENMFQRHSEHINLWVAVLNGNIVCGALCFYANKHVVYWHGSARQEYFVLRPVNLLMSEIIRNSCERGYSWFDFNPSGGHEGVTSFKKSFGAKPLPCPTVTNLPAWAKTIVMAQGKAYGAVRRIKKMFL